MQIKVSRNSEAGSRFLPLKIAAAQKFKVQPFEEKGILGRVRLLRVTKVRMGVPSSEPQSRNLSWRTIQATFVSFRNSALVHDVIEQCFVDELCCVDRSVDFLRSTGKVDKQLISAHPVSPIGAEQIQELLVSQSRGLLVHAEFPREELRRIGAVIANIIHRAQRSADESFYRVGLLLDLVGIHDHSRARNINIISGRGELRKALFVGKEIKWRAQHRRGDGAGSQCCKPFRRAAHRKEIDIALRLQPIFAKDAAHHGIDKAARIERADRLAFEVGNAAIFGLRV